MTSVIGAGLFACVCVYEFLLSIYVRIFFIYVHILYISYFCICIRAFLCFSVCLSIYVYLSVSLYVSVYGYVCLRPPMLLCLLLSFFYSPSRLCLPACPFPPLLGSQRQK